MSFRDWFLFESNGLFIGICLGLGCGALFLLALLPAGRASHLLLKRIPGLRPEPCEGQGAASLFLHVALSFALATALSALAISLLVLGAEAFLAWLRQG